ncbi:MAG: glutamate synthase small subunit [Epsilonproteobacteria bacterium]|nr:MAG: glutamate synthase small subunit [Campylobacterota bacterium]
MLEFTKIQRDDQNKRGVMNRIKDFDEVYEIFDELKSAKQASRCMQCGDPYCHTGCPLHNIIPAWLKQTAQNDLELAFDISNETSPFPEILGRICPQDVLCEGACSLNDTHKAITIGSIETYISETGFNSGLKPKYNKTKIGKKVAIVGSGPAGLSCATFLLRAGIDVTIYERASKPGGLLTYGIPGFKLDKKVINRRIKLLQEIGLQIKLECEIGENISIDSLQKDFDAVFLSIGATKGNYANIPGEKNSNVYASMEFLISAQKTLYKEKNFKTIDVNNKNIVVVGGGDTAMDCLRVAIRQGANSIKCLYRRSEKSMPGSKKEIANAKEEGAEFVFNVAPIEILKNSIKLQKTKEFDKKLTTIKNSEFEIKADIVILALGFSQALPKFLTGMNIKLDKWHGVIVDENQQTSIKNIYAGGDMTRGAHLAVTATNDGKIAAKSIAKSFEN